MNNAMPGLREGPRLRVLHFLLCCLFSMSACDYTNANPNIEISKDFMEISPLRTYSATGLDVVIMGPCRKSNLSDEQMLK